MGRRRSNCFYITRRGGGGRDISISALGISVADPDSVNSDPVSRELL